MYTVPTTIRTNNSNVTLYNPIPVGITYGSSYISSSNPLPVGVSFGSNNISLNNPIPVGIALGSSNISYSNPLPVSVGSEVVNVAFDTSKIISTNMMFQFSNISTSNPLPIGITVGTGNVSLGNPLPIGISLGSNSISTNNPMPVGITVGSSNISSSNALPVELKLNATNVSKANPIPISLNYPNATTPLTVAYPYGFTDAFGRLRVSSPYTLFDHYHRYTEDDKMVIFKENNAGETFVEYEASMALWVGSNTGDKVYKESTKVFPYQPGKSLQTFQSFCFGPPKIGLRQRHGYFDTSNGVYIQLEDSNVSFVRRSFVSGSLKETVVLQDSWNYDTMRGTGPSQFTLDITRSQIFYMDIEWLGVGSVRCGFVIDGLVCICHAFHHANHPSTDISDTSYPYMSTACLPVRMEIENIGETVGTMSILRTICLSMISEGGYELVGRNFSAGINTLTTPITLALANTFYNVCSIRLKQNRLGAIVIPIDIGLVPLTAGFFKWVLIRNGTITSSPVWVSAGTDSATEYCIEGKTVTGGNIIKSGFIAATNNSANSLSFGGTFRFQLERNSFTSTPYNFTLAISSNGTNDTVLGSIDWQEFTS